MKPDEENPTVAGNGPAEPAAAGKPETTGLPWFRTWNRVYLFVLGCFVLYVLLLTALSMAFS